MNNNEKKVCFPIKKSKSDDYAWIELWKKMPDKIIIRATNLKMLHNGKRITGSSGHRQYEIQVWGGTLAQPKTWDILKVIEKE